MEPRLIVRGIDTGGKKMSASKKSSEDISIGSLLSPFVLVIKYALLALRISMVKDIECSSCGEVIDPMGYWRCGCGFTAPYERHALLPCPQCRRIFSWIQCPFCEMRDVSMKHVIFDCKSREIKNKRKKLIEEIGDLFDKVDEIV